MIGKFGGFYNRVFCASFVTILMVGAFNHVWPQQVEAPFANESAISQAERIKVFEEVWSTVNREFYDPNFNGLNWDSVKEKYQPQAVSSSEKTRLHEVLQRMLAELRCSHLSLTLYLKSKKQQIEQSLGRSYQKNESLSFGSGLHFQSIEGQVFVSKVANGSTADRAGIQRGWVVAQWQGSEPRNPDWLTCNPFQQVNASFRDLNGIEQRLILNCDLYAETYSRPEFVSTDLGNGTFYLRFPSFSAGTDAWLAKQIKTFKTAKVLIIDLRENQGGSIGIMEKSLAPFFKTPVSFGAFHPRKGKNVPLETKGWGKNAFDGKLIVLIDETTLSAAEMMADAFQSKGRAVLIGRQTNGQVLGSLDYRLSHGFHMKIPIWDYFNADGKRLEGVGVKPDIFVGLTRDDFLAKRDALLARALEQLQSR